MKKHYRLAIYLCAYDPYKDVFDIFMEQFKKNWPDCPYPLVIANMHFKYEGDNVIVINCGDEPDPSARKRIAVQTIDADYHLGFEEDRMIMAPVNTRDVEDILDFMDKENVPYFRCNPSLFRKKPEDRFPGYEHYYHIPANEPYGVCGSTVIWKREFLDLRRENELSNGYIWEAYQNKRAAFSTDRWVFNYATSDRNIFHIMHCIDKQKWILPAKLRLIKEGYKISGRETHSIPHTLYTYASMPFKFVPGKTRYTIKKILSKFGFRFYSEY